MTSHMGEKGGHTMASRHQGDEVTIHLANGDELHLSFTEKVGIEGYGVCIHASKPLVVLPLASNTAVITTPKAMAELEARSIEAVSLRKAQRGATGAAT